MICTDLPTPQYFFFAEGVPLLLYYSHLPAIIVSLLVGIFVLVKSKFSLLSKLLFCIASSFSLWVFLDLILWTNNQSNLVFFLWSWFGILYAAISLLSIYFIEVFLHKNDLSFKRKVILAALALPVIVLTPTRYNLSGFNLSLCAASGYEGLPFVTYYTMLGIVAMIWIGSSLFKKFLRSDTTFRRQIVLIGAGIELFLFSFFVTGFLASYLNDQGLASDYSLEQYGLFGMLGFMTFIAYLIVKYQAFSVKLIGAQALLISLVILVGSQFFFVRTSANRILVTITLAFTSIIGVLLVRSVKKEVEQREYLEKISKELSSANDQLRTLDKQKNEFLSFASHDLKSPIALIKQFATLIYDGTYKEPQKVHETVLKIKNTADRAVNMVNTFLDLRKIEEGHMDYNLEKKNIVDFVGGITNDFALLAKQQKNIDITFSSSSPTLEVSIDTNTFRQVIQNFLDNSLKYTEAGWIKVTIAEEQKTILIKISDSGLGMDKELLPVLFGQFHRDPGAAKKIQGTGLGLYISKQIVIAHHGETWAESEGKGKGSQFYIRLLKA